MSGELSDAFEVLADLIARVGVPADRPVRSVGAVPQHIPEEQQPPVIVNGIQNAVTTADELSDAFEVLADLIARLGVPADRPIGSVGAVAQQIPEEQKSPVVVNGVEDPTSVGCSHRQLLDVVRHGAPRQRTTCGCDPNCYGTFPGARVESPQGRRCTLRSAAPDGPSQPVRRERPRAGGSQLSVRPLLGQP